MAKFEVKPATAADLEKFYGAPHGVTCRAIVVTLDGEPMGVGGVYYYRRHVMAFSEIKPEFVKYPKLVYKAAQATMEVIKAVGVPVCAMADKEHPNSAKMLERFGFTESHETEDGKVFQWP